MPQPSARPFLFDTSFDPEPIEETVEQEAALPPEPTFSTAELEAARAIAYEEGLQAGRVATEASLAADTAAILAHISSAMSELMSGQNGLEQASQQDAIRIAMTIARKLFPALDQREGLSEIKALIATCIADAREEPRLVVRVHDSMFDTLKSQIDALTTSLAFAGNVVLVADEALGKTDCRVEWADGGAERSVARLTADVELAAAKLLNARNAPPSKAGTRPDGQDNSGDHE